MPRQSPARRTYTKALSSLRKNELLQLSAEFNLPIEGSVITLRNRLKTHLTRHNEALYRDPRYKALYPKVRKVLNKCRVDPDNSSTIPTPPASPTLSYRVPSPAPSYASWHGINDLHPPSRSPSPIQNPPDFGFDLPHPSPPSVINSIPLPPPSIPDSIHNFPLLDFHRPAGCKLMFFVTLLLYMALRPFSWTPPLPVSFPIIQINDILSKHRILLFLPFFVIIHGDPFVFLGHERTPFYYIHTSTLTNRHGRPVIVFSGA